ncbi:tripartite motif-containing 13-like [Haliotis rubra]|uniref:tripartite motif-containing 13-like n=1 Tax=Haliotis rubra TaxID=36100 RepID=UPI001EE61F80|nr:tripartite motif-containing 13-like [Haliotis rubra]
MATGGIAEEDLQCPICTEVFGDPKMLPCTHRICKSCLNQFIGSRPKATTAPCPLCNQPFKIPKSAPGSRDYASRFRTDEILQGIVHEKQKMKLMITDRPVSTCSLHNAIKSMFCFTCSKLECVECIAMRHKRCQSKFPLKDAIPRIQNKATDYLAEVQPLLKGVYSSLSRIHDQKQKALDNYSAVAFALDTQKSTWISLVEDHYAPLEQLATRAHKDNMAQLNTVLSELQQSQRALEEFQSSLNKITSYVSVDVLFQEEGNYGSKPPDLESMRGLMRRRLTIESLKFMPLPVPRFPKRNHKTVLGEIKSGSEVVRVHDDTMSTRTLILLMSGCLITFLLAKWRRV